MAKTYNEVVNHLTRVVLQLRPDPDCYDVVNKAQQVTPQLVKEFSQVLANRAERVAAIMDALAASGFVFFAKDDVIYADSKTVEAYEVKQYLIDRGFKDREFQIILEYARKWDML
jgi:SOS response regulatory protein OraA/RecX